MFERFGTMAPIPEWRGGAQRRPLIYLFATGFLVGKKKESRKILILPTPF